MLDAISHASQGQAVAVIGESSLVRFREAHTLVQGDPNLSYTHSANGDQEIRFKNGGKITFLRNAAHVRGYTLDAVYLTDLFKLRDALEDIIPCFMHLPNVRIGALA